MARPLHFPWREDKIQWTSLDGKVIPALIDQVLAILTRSVGDIETAEEFCHDDAKLHKRKWFTNATHWA